MKYNDSHLPDEQLLLDIDGEISKHDERLVRAHLDACWKCRARRQELENAIALFVRAQQNALDAKSPPVAGPRALLKARIAELPESTPGALSRWSAFAHRFELSIAAAACFIAIGGVVFVRLGAGHHAGSPPSHQLMVSIPDARLTPGAAVLENEQAVCAAPNTKNKVVPVSVQRQVFAEYGIPQAAPQAYEVDYLITPALGGADDIHNLWPHSYSATVWNAQVKDALEDRLRELVCDGSVELKQAQQEISTNWIAAYQKYFHTKEPLAEHTKQRAW